MIRYGPEYIRSLRKRRGRLVLLRPVKKILHPEFMPVTRNPLADEGMPVRLGDFSYRLIGESSDVTKYINVIDVLYQYRKPTKRRRDAFIDHLLNGIQHRLED